MVYKFGGNLSISRRSPLSVTKRVHVRPFDVPPNVPPTAEAGPAAGTQNNIHSVVSKVGIVPRLNTNEMSASLPRRPVR